MPGVFQALIVSSDFSHVCLLYSDISKRGWGGYISDMQDE